MFAERSITIDKLDVFLCIISFLDLFGKFNLIKVNNSNANFRFIKSGWYGAIVAPGARG